MILNMGGGGVVPEMTLDATIITPGTENQIIPSGTYLRGDLTVLGDADIIPELLPKDVNIFGVQGVRPSNYGENVWLKCASYTPGKSGSVKVTSATTNGYSYASLNIEVTGTISAEEISASDLIGWVLFSNCEYNGNYYTYTVANATQITYVKSGSTFTAEYSYNPSTRQIIISNSSHDVVVEAFNAGKISTKTITKNPSYGEHLGYVVHDDVSAYPNGATHTDGLYYELFAQVASANVMSLSDGVIATVQEDYREQIETEVTR